MTAFRTVSIFAGALASLSLLSGCSSTGRVPQVSAATTVFTGTIANPGGPTSLPTFRTNAGVVYLLANVPTGTYAKGQRVTLQGRLEVIGARNVQKALRQTFGSDWKQVQVRSAHQVGGMVFLVDRAA